MKKDFPPQREAASSRGAGGASGHLYDAHLSEEYSSAGIGTSTGDCMYLPVAGFRRAVPSTRLDERGRLHDLHVIVAQDGG